MPKNPTHYQVYSLSTSSTLLSTEVLFFFDPHTNSSSPSSPKFLYHQSVSLPSFRSSSSPLPTLTQTSVLSNLEYLGYIRSKSRMEKACALAETVQRGNERPFKEFTNDVIRVWIRKRLLRWERKRKPCGVKDSILEAETLETGDRKSRLSKYERMRKKGEMMRDRGYESGEDEYDDSSSSSSSSLASSSLASSSSSQHPLSRSTRESHRRLSRARTTHHSPSSTHSWSSKSSSNPPKRFSVSVSLSTKSSSNPRRQSSSHSRSRSRAPPSSRHDHDQYPDYDSGIGMSEDEFTPHDDGNDDAKSYISSSSINPGSSISHSDRAYSSSSSSSSSSSHSSAPPSSKHAHPKKEVSPPIFVVAGQRDQEEATRHRIFRKKKAEYMNSSSSPSSSSGSSSGSSSQSRSRAQSQRSHTPPTQASHIPPFNNPFRLSVAGEAKPDPWVGR